MLLFVNPKGSLWWWGQLLGLAMVVPTGGVSSLDLRWWCQLIDHVATMPSLGWRTQNLKTNRYSYFLYWVRKMIARFCLALRIPVEWCWLKMMMLKLAQPLVHRPDVQVCHIVNIVSKYWFHIVDCHEDFVIFLLFCTWQPDVRCWYHFNPGADSLCRASHAPRPSRIFVKEAYDSPFAEDEGCNRWWVTWSKMCSM